VIEDRGDIREVNQASRKQHILALQAIGLALAVPALKSLGDAVSDRVGEPEILAQR
jgi:hypothetical protein